VLVSFTQVTESWRLSLGGLNLAQVPPRTDKYGETVNNLAASFNQQTRSFLSVEADVNAACLSAKASYDPGRKTHVRGFGGCHRMLPKVSRLSIGLRLVVKGESRLDVAVFLAIVVI
jgi:hypothetical protein